MQNLKVDDLTEALASGSDALFDLMRQRLKNAPGFDLFTVLAPRADGLFLDRVYSTNQDQYPLGEADKVEENIWFERLFSQKKPIVTNTLEEIGEWLPDYQIFIEQNYASLLNLPIVFEGETIGVVNMMGQEHHFSEDAMTKIRSEIPLAALALLGQRGA